MYTRDQDRNRRRSYLQEIDGSRFEVEVNVYFVDSKVWLSSRDNSSLEMLKRGFEQRTRRGWSVGREWKTINKKK
jgi:hypothetical protein